MTMWQQYLHWISGKKKKKFSSDLSFIPRLAHSFVKSIAQPFSCCCKKVFWYQTSDIFCFIKKWERSLFHFCFLLLFLYKSGKNIFKNPAFQSHFHLQQIWMKKNIVKNLQSSPVLIAVLMSEAGSVMSVCQTSGLCNFIGIARGPLVPSQEVDASTLTGNDTKTVR